MPSCKMASDLYGRLGTVIANDTGSLKQTTNALKVAPIIGAFNQTPNLAVADLVFADDGFANPVITLATGAQDDGIKPGTGNVFAHVIPPAGGLLWEFGGADEVVFVYGYALLSNDLTKVFATVKLDERLELTVDGQQIESPPFDIEFEKANF